MMEMFSETFEQRLHICRAGFSRHARLRVAVMVQLLCHCQQTQVNACDTRALRLRNPGSRSGEIAFSRWHRAPTHRKLRLSPHSGKLWQSAKWKGSSAENLVSVRRSYTVPNFKHPRRPRGALSIAK